MGSEHYCLRWNNHQSNLLGVFSQLLQDESLVDVTLACSEGASIRAHKVVLSACSSYFQSLFLDHPGRHPIVILKDVRFSELQTLVEFMYKGEVNVQYCQLSALLKTAESLKVKGLAEMTNQSTALREPEREPDRLRPHSQPTKPSSACESPLEIPGAPLTPLGTLQQHQHQHHSQQHQPHHHQQPLSSSSSNSLNSTTPTSLKRDNCDRSSPSSSPIKRLHQTSPAPLDLYQRKCPSRHSHRDRSSGDQHISSGGGRTPTLDEQASPSDHRHHVSPPLHDEDDDDDDDDDNMSNDVGLNMTMNAASNSIGGGGGNGSGNGAGASNSGLSSSQNAAQTVLVPPVGTNSSNLASIPSSSDLARPLSRGGVGGGSVSGGGGGVNLGGITHTATSSSGLTSPIITSAEQIPGPSGLGPVQSVPLVSVSRSRAFSSFLSDAWNLKSFETEPYQTRLKSLKKEIEWDRNDDKSTGDTMDYRHSHDSETSESPHTMMGVVVGTSSSSVGVIGIGGVNIGGGSGVVGGSGTSSVSISALDQGSGSGANTGAIYPCMYCGATFPHQSKLTRHILSHSLETLKYRETAHLLHPGHLANLLPHELPPLQHFPHRQGPSGLEKLEPPDGSSPMEIEFAAAAAAAAAAASGGNNATGGVSAGSSGVVGSLISGQCSSMSAASGSVSISGVSDPNSVVLCKFCGKSFPDVASLITHLPVHTGDRPFKCEFCGKAFKLRHHMKDHCRVHTGERPFRCSMCGKTFSRSTILKAHEKTHFPKYVRKFLSTSPVDTKDELPQ